MPGYGAIGLTIEADYFWEKKSNMLIPPATTVPIEYGIGLSQVNAGIMANKGFELSLGSKVPGFQKSAIFPEWQFYICQE